MLKKEIQVYYPMLYLAIIGTGARFTGSNPAYTSLELNHHVHTSHAMYIISEPHMLATVRASAEACNIPNDKVFVFDAYDKAPYDNFPYRSWETLLQHGETNWVVFKDPKQEIRSTIATLAFTSGTTGLPKAAMISHHYSVNQIYAIKSHSKPYEVGLPYSQICAVIVIDYCTGQPPDMSSCVSQFRFTHDHRLRNSRAAVCLHHASIRYQALSRIHKNFRHHGDPHGPCHDNCSSQLSLDEEREPTVATLYLVRRISITELHAGGVSGAVGSGGEGYAGLGDDGDRLVYCIFLA